MKTAKVRWCGRGSSGHVITILTMAWKRIGRCYISSLEAVSNWRCGTKVQSRWISTATPSSGKIPYHTLKYESMNGDISPRQLLHTQQWKTVGPHGRLYSTKARAHSDKKHKDLYAIMGVSPHATQVQIKEAYYRLSMKYHPDRNKGSEDAHQKFTELTEAYSILGQYDLRRRYDKGMLHEYRRPPSHTHSEHTTHHHSSTAAHSSSRGGASTVHGKKSRFDFDEFYRAHYGEALRREQEARRKRAAAKEMAKLRSISNTWHQILIIWVCVSVLLVGWYGYSWRRGMAPSRTKTTSTNNIG